MSAQTMIVLTKVGFLAGLFNALYKTKKQIGRKLSEAEIDRRLTEVAQLAKMLHAKDQQTKAQLRAENRQLKATIAELINRVDQQSILIADLQKKVYGKRRKRDKFKQVRLKLVSPKPRDKASYRRDQPAVEDITSTTTIPLPDRCDCGGDIQNKTVLTRYEEDIPLPDLTADYQSKLVNKLLIEKGVCVDCRRVVVAKDGSGKPYSCLSGQTTTIGNNTRLFVSYLSRLGLSYSQIKSL